MFSGPKHSKVRATSTIQDTKPTPKPVEKAAEPVPKPTEPNPTAAPRKQLSAETKEDEDEDDIFAVKPEKSEKKVKRSEFPSFCSLLPYSFDVQMPFGAVPIFGATKQTPETKQVTKPVSSTEKETIQDSRARGPSVQQTVSKP